MLGKTQRHKFFFLVVGLLSGGRGQTPWTTQKKRIQLDNLDHFQVIKKMVKKCGFKPLRPVVRPLKKTFLCVTSHMYLWKCVCIDEISATVQKRQIALIKSVFKDAIFHCYKRYKAAKNCDIKKKVMICDHICEVHINMYSTHF